jgi:hypothetical protein
LSTETPLPLKHCWDGAAAHALSASQKKKKLRREVHYEVYSPLVYAALAFLLGITWMHTTHILHTHTTHTHACVLFDVGSLMMGPTRPILVSYLFISLLSIFHITWFFSFLYFSPHPRCVCGVVASESPVCSDFKRQM